MNPETKNIVNREDKFKKNYCENANIFLSIISPFYNSVGRCDALIKKIKEISDLDVECIFVDDGSTDNTFNFLINEIKDVRTPIQLIRQNNKGAGGARNTGLRASSGKFIWYVDSDDEIELTAISTLRKNKEKDFDFIDFNYTQNGNQTDSMNLKAGEYNDPNKTRDILLNRFGMHWCKIFRRSFLVENGLLFPEHCINQDTAFIGYTSPKYTKRFIKLDAVAYHYSTAGPSINRRPISSRVIDRVLAANWGMSKTEDLMLIDKYRELFAKKWFRYSIQETAIPLLRSQKISLWLLAAKVINYHRSISKERNLPYRFWSLLPGNLKLRTAILLVWMISYLLPKQDRSLENIRRSRWDGDL